MGARRATKAPGVVAEQRTRPRVSFEPAHVRFHELRPIDVVPLRRSPRLRNRFAVASRQGAISRSGSQSSPSDQASNKPPANPHRIAAIAKIAWKRAAGTIVETSVTNRRSGGLRSAASGV